MNEASKLAARPQTPGRSWLLAKLPTEHAVSAGALLVLLIVLSLIAPGFLSIDNFMNVARVVSITGIMAAGMTFVILTGGIDLSVGSTFALVGAVTSALVAGAYTDSPFIAPLGLPVPLAAAIGLGVGAAVGFTNGLIIAKTRIEPFMATLGTMIFVRGLLYLFTGGYPILFESPMNEDFAWVGQGYALGLPTPVVAFGVVIVVSWWISRRTTFGRSVYATGGNEEAAWLSGLDVGRTKILAYTLLGVLAGVSGIILSSRVGAASPVAGVGLELAVIAGVVIGGTSLAGGRGSIVGTVLGVFILGVIQNALNLLGVSTDWQYISSGLLLLAAVSMDGFVRSRRQDLRPGPTTEHARWPPLFRLE